MLQTQGINNNPAAQQNGIQTIPSQKQTLKVSKQLKQGASKKKLPDRNLSPLGLKKPQTFPTQVPQKNSKAQIVNISQGRDSLTSGTKDSYNQTKKFSATAGKSNMFHQSPILNDTPHSKEGSQGHKLFSASHQFQLSQTQKVKSSFVETATNIRAEEVKHPGPMPKQPQLANHSMQKHQQKQVILQKIKETNMKGDFFKHQGPQQHAQIALYNSAQYGSNVYPNSNYHSKSPTEKMLESSVLQQVETTLGSKGKIYMEQISLPKQTSKALTNKSQTVAIANKTTKLVHLQLNGKKTNTKEFSNSKQQSIDNNSMTKATVGSTKSQSHPKKILVMPERDDDDDFNEGSGMYKMRINLDEESFSVSQFPQVIPQSFKLLPSPNKSGRVPNSLPFKRKSLESIEANNSSLELPSQKQSGKLESAETVFKRLTAGGGLQDLKLKPKPIVPITSDDDPNLTVRRKRTDIMFSQQVVQKQYSGKGRTISGTSYSAQQSPKVLEVQRNKKNGCPHLITNGTSLINVLKFLEFGIVIEIMSLIKFCDRRNSDFRSSSEWISIQKAFKSQLKEFLMQNLPSTRQRIKFWNFKTKIQRQLKKQQNYYNVIRKQSLNHLISADIRKDIGRTFPDYHFFSQGGQGQQMLFRILSSIAQDLKKTGYIQGLNFLTGTILLNLQQEEPTFWMLKSILQDYNFEKVLDLNNGGIFQILCFQLDVFMSVYLPKLSEHFRFLKIPTDIYAANWFITIFCYELSLDLVCCIIDVFLLEGIKSLIRFSLALLCSMEDRLLKMSYDECMEFLSHSQKDIEIDSQTLMKTAFSFKITDGLRSDLELFYRLQNRPSQQIFKAFSKIQLCEESVEQIVEMKKGYSFKASKTKYYWLVLPATSDDVSLVLRLDRDLREEEIHIFYQDNIKSRRLREIIEQFYTDEDSEIANVTSYALEKKDILNSKMLHPSRKKHREITKESNIRVINFYTDSNNTIDEMNGDKSSTPHKNIDLSISNKNNVSVASELAAINSSFNIKPSPVFSKTKSGSPVNVITPRKAHKIQNSMSSKAEITARKQESPFIQIGSKIKSIFGNFFNTQEKINKSYEEGDGAGEAVIQIRSRSEYKNMLQDSNGKHQRSKSNYNRNEPPEIAPFASKMQQYGGTSDVVTKEYKTSGVSSKYDKKKPTESKQLFPNSGHQLYFGASSPHTKQQNLKRILESIEDSEEAHSPSTFRYFVHQQMKLKVYSQNSKSFDRVDEVYLGADSIDNEVQRMTGSYDGVI